MNKTLLIGLVVVLGGLMFLTQPEKKTVNLRSTRILQMDPQEIHSISIGTSSKEEVSLEKRGETWVVSTLNGFAADGKKISQMLQDLFLLNYGALMQKEGAELEAFGLSSNSTQNTKISLKDSAGTILTSLVFGNSRLSKGQYGFDVPSGQYIQVEGDSAVYLLKDQQSISKDSDQWIHKNLPVLNPDKIQKISIRPGKDDGFDLIRLKAEEPLILSDLTEEEKMKEGEVESLQEVMKDFSFSSLEAKDSEAVTKSLTTVEEIQFMTSTGLTFYGKIGVKAGSSGHRYLVPEWSGINADEESAENIKAWNSQFSGWALGISDFQAKKLLKSRGDFVESKPLGARHILISFDGASNSKSKRSKKEARELAEGLIKQLSDGGDFTALAKEFSSDESNKEKGGDLGTFAKGAMVKPFEDATLGLQIGERTKEPVETQYGFHIIERTQ